MNPATTVSLMVALLSGGRWQVDQLGQPGAVPAGGAEGDLVGLGALQVQVGRVLPGHPDAAVQLDGLLGGPHRDVPAERRGHRTRTVRSGSSTAVVTAA